MAGLLSDVLPYLYSQGDRAKRYMKGLLSDPVGSAAQTAGLLSDKHREMQALQAQAFPDQSRPFKVGDRKALGQMADAMLAGPLGFAPAGITVWHGSPHKFDKFDSSKIGTGEGAQAYGHGLYLAENQKVADSYRYVHGGGVPTVDAISIGDKVISGLSTPSRHGLGLTPSRAAAEIPGITREQAQALAILEGAKGDAAKALSIAANKGDNRLYAAVEEMAPQFKVVKMAGPDTHLYKVDLPDDQVAKMLDWDKPLSQQAPEVRAALEKAKYKPDAPDVTGSQVLMDLAFNHGGESAASNWLRAQGIPGVRYLDGGSRGQGGGTSNYVIFPGNEGLLSILERNGQPIR